MVYKKVVLKTDDNYNIVANHYSRNGNSVILLHQLGSSKESWNKFAEYLQDNNYDVLVLDLRGHGESQGNLSSFTEKDFNNMEKDIKAAVIYLNKKRVAIIGASIGANLALNYGAKDNTINNIVMLSPGLNYRGLDAEKNAPKYDRNSLIIVSREDSYSYMSSNRLIGLLKGNKQIKIYNNLGHGTNMLNKELNKFILDWLNSNSVN